MARGRLMVLLIVAVVSQQVKAHNYNRDARSGDEVENSKDEDNGKSAKKKTTDTTVLKTILKTAFIRETSSLPTHDKSTQAAHFDKSFERGHRTDDDASPDNSVVSLAVPVGVAVGLLFLGLVVGVIVTCLLCACVPSLNKKATSFLTRHRKPTDGAKNEKTDPAKDSQVQPTAPPASFRIEHQNGTHADDQRGSHIYNQPEMSFVKNPIPTSQAIASPVYNELTDDIIASSSKSINPEYQLLNAKTTDSAMYGYRQLEPSGSGENFHSKTSTAENVPADTGTSVDHNYFILNPEVSSALDSVSGSADDIDNSAHAYFVLEKNFRS
ncbi:uncharacterized protein LOC127832289 [Dreissena polymorpha]|uniref:Uncharacterized protein n=1 Tax=Dreissena polymorpha TaxID=45954 RepID=A0A9D4GGQ2_DREPO|nr:uncharacterized protein LOC127832289 [Dreissena polymorpha]KAH3816473.1 hypothetical protein DPMN_117989 [Dreissena polymorpha]